MGYNGNLWRGFRIGMKEKRIVCAHGASLMASLEGMSRPAYRIAMELAGNSRSGLTVRFLAKKLELPPEEVEYSPLDVHDSRLFSNT